MNITVKDLCGYEGLYLIDSLGNVVSIPKLQGSRFVNQYKILGTKINRMGYKEVALTKAGKTKTFLLHRLIALHFVDNPNKYPCVNHLNGIKTDNRIENLQWCTRSQNTKHAYDNNLGKFRDLVNANLKNLNQQTQYVVVKLIAPNGEEITFTNTKEAAQYVGTNRDEITRAIRKEQRVKGYLAFGIKQSDLC